MRIVLFLLVIISEIIPELLDRSSDIANSYEWDQIQNNYASALKKLNTNPKNINAFISLVGLFMTEARISGEHGHYFPGALNLINHALMLEPSEDERFMLISYKASVLLSQHQFSDALDAAQKAIRLNPRNAQTYGALVDAHVELGQYKQAVSAADKMVSMRPDLRSYSRVSYVRQIHGDIEGAIEAMKLAIQAGVPGQEDRSWAMLTLGELYEEIGKIAEARMIYSSILNERKNYPFAIGALAWLDLKDDELEKAESGFTKAAAIIPEVDFYIGLAQIIKIRSGVDYTDNKKYKEMLVTIQEMYEDDVVHGHDMDMSYVDLHLELTENLDKALTYGLKEYNKRPDNIEVNKILAIIYYKRQNYKKASDHLGGACINSCNTPIVQMLSGLLDYAQGNKDEAKKALERVQKNYPNQQHHLMYETEQVLSTI